MGTAKIVLPERLASGVSQFGMLRRPAAVKPDVSHGRTRPGQADTAWLSQPCRWNCMNAAFMLYEQADRGRGRAGPGSPEPARTHQHHKPRNPETAKHQNALEPGFHCVPTGSAYPDDDADDVGVT